jgi:hypothetical protein
MLQEVSWNEVCPWLLLVKALRVSLRARVILLAVVGVFATELGWTAIDRLLGDETTALPRLSSVAVPPELDLQNPATLEQLQLQIENAKSARLGPVVKGWRWLSEPLLRVVDPQLGLKSSLILLLSALWALAVWALLGGAIARIAAVDLTRGEMIGLGDALRAAAGVWLDTLGAPVIVGLGATAIATPLVLAGLVIRLNLLALFTGMLWIVFLAFGALLAVVLIGLVLGWPFLASAAAVERSDALDAISRASAYLYQRPLYLLFYVIVASILGVLGAGVLQVFATATELCTQWFVSWGSGAARLTELTAQAPPEGLAAWAGDGIEFWSRFLQRIVDAYPAALLWPMAVGCYLLQRRHVDSTELDEIKLLGDEPHQAPPKPE